MCCERIISPIPRTAHRKLLIRPLKLRRWLGSSLWSPAGVAFGRPHPRPLSRKRERGVRPQKHSPLRRLLAEFDHPPAGAGRLRGRRPALAGSSARSRPRYGSGLPERASSAKLAEHVRFLGVRRHCCCTRARQRAACVLHVEIAARRRGTPGWTPRTPLRCRTRGARSRARKEPLGPADVGPLLDLGQERTVETGRHAVGKEQLGREVGRHRRRAVRLGVLGQHVAADLAWATASSSPTSVKRMLYQPKSPRQPSGSSWLWVRMLRWKNSSGAET